MEHIILWGLTKNPAPEVLNHIEMDKKLGCTNTQTCNHLSHDAEESLFLISRIDGKEIEFLNQIDEEEYLVDIGAVRPLVIRNYKNYHAEAYFHREEE